MEKHVYISGGCVKLRGTRITWNANMAFMSENAQK